MTRVFIAFLVLAAGALTACGHAVQTSSGSDYLARTPAGGTIDPEIARIAAVEPDLRFPARIGVARIVNGMLTLPPAGEAELFADIAGRHRSLGRFVAVSPLVAAMVTGAPNDAATRRYHGRVDPKRMMDDVRAAAARQHLDYVLIYEIGARSRTENTPFALADVTLIGGALLPTRSIRVVGIGQALFVDVRNGYPYGTAQAAEDLSGLARSFGHHRTAEALRERAILKTAEALVPEVEAMFVELGRRGGAGG
ncbi:MAG TPA: hypothetical protein DDY29_12680 [Rhodobacteraceae bacterium]|jgi:hypothetical protein|nr:hypothetical protein [Paracoccaceae bacterium]